ncbi:MAG TPA: DUF423 domain-containing protein [Rhizomicrobium sp.]
MIARPWLLVAAINGFLSVAAGAFAAHGLEGHIDSRALSAFETGARYQMVHALAIGLASLAFCDAKMTAAQFACALFLAGIILFPGSLYALALTGVHGFGFVTPVGGLALLAGWAALGWSAMKPEPR